MRSRLLSKGHACFLLTKAVVYVILLASCVSCVAKSALFRVSSHNRAASILTELSMKSTVCIVVFLGMQ